MTSTVVQDLLKKTKALQVQNKTSTRKVDIVKRKQEYEADNAMKTKLEVDLKSMLDPIVQELLTTVIKKKKQGNIIIKSKFDNQRYKMTIRVQKHR